MVKTRSDKKTRQLSAFLPRGRTKSQSTKSDENGKIGAKVATVSEKSKRTADMSPAEAPARKRSAFGDITNAIFNQPPEKGTKVKGKNTKKATSHSEALRMNSPERSKSKPQKPVGKASSDSEPDFLDLDLLSSPSGGFSSSQESVDSSSVNAGSPKTDEQNQTSSDSAISTNGEYAASSGSENEILKDEVQPMEQDENVETPKEVMDIDADVSDPFLVAEYAEEIFKNMKTRENLFPMKPYMDRQDDITPNMRAILVDWLVEVQENFELYHETLYLGVKLLDHYLAKNKVPKQNLQLVGAASLFISSKVEERHPPCLDDFLYICDDAYQHDQFINMERKILANMEYDINIPIPYRFLRRYAKAAFAKIETLTLARFVLESTLQDCSFIDYKASFLAAACLALALLMNNAGDWTQTLVHYTGYTKEDLKDCILKLNAIISEPPKKTLMTVRNKYSHKVFHEVAKIPPLDVLTLQF